MVTVTVTAPLGAVTLPVPVCTLNGAAARPCACSFSTFAEEFIAYIRAATKLPSLPSVNGVTQAECQRQRETGSGFLTYGPFFAGRNLADGSAPRGTPFSNETSQMRLR